MSRVPEGWNFFPVSNFLRESRISGGDGTTPHKISVKLYGKGVLAKENGRNGSSATKYFVRKSGQFIYSKLDFLNGAFGLIPDSLDGYQSTLDLPAFDFVGDICPQWFLYTVSQPVFYSAFLGRAAGGRKARRVNPKELLATELVFPSFSEQKRIAVILSSVDEAIAATETVIEQTQRVKEGLLQNLLTRGIGHTRFKQTEIGEIPEGWEVKRLEEVVQPSRKITYGIVQTGDAVPNGVRCVRVVDITKDHIAVDQMITTSEEISGQYKRTVLQNGDLMFALRGEIGLCRQVKHELVGCNLTRGVALISPQGVLSRYLLWALRSPIVRNDILMKVNGSALKEIPLNQLRKVLVPIPSSEKEQAKIAEYLDRVLAGERAHQEKLSQLQQTKRGLMQDLLSGAVRV